jgi:hypothetical protein
MNKNVGSKVWFIPDCFWNSRSNGFFESHESICVLNPGSEDADIKLTLYFEDRDKMDGFSSGCKAERTHHIRLDKLRDVNGNPIPKDTPYAVMVESNVNIIVQYSRMDTSQAEMGLMPPLNFSSEIPSKIDIVREKPGLI